MAAPFLWENPHGMAGNGLGRDFNGVEIPSPALPLWRENSKASALKALEDSQPGFLDQDLGYSRCSVENLPPFFRPGCPRSLQMEPHKVWERGIHVGTRDPRAQALPSHPAQLREHPENRGWNLAAFLAFLLKINPGVLDCGRNP